MQLRRCLVKQFRTSRVDGRAAQPESTSGALRSPITGHVRVTFHQLLPEAAADWKCTPARPNSDGQRRAEIFSTVFQDQESYIVALMGPPDERSHAAQERFAQC